MMQEVVKNVRMQISEGRLEAESWYQKLDEDARTQYRLSARSLFQGLMTYVATNGEEAARKPMPSDMNMLRAHAATT